MQCKASGSESWVEEQKASPNVKVEERFAEVRAAGDYVVQLYMVSIRESGDELTIKGSKIRMRRKAYANGFGAGYRKVVGWRRKSGHRYRRCKSAGPKEAPKYSIWHHIGTSKATNRERIHTR